MNIALPSSNSLNVSNRGISRSKAATIHLLISAVITGFVLLLMLALWYPRPYFDAAGAGHLLFLLITVDVVIGPLITFVIFDTKKKSLKFDLAVVAGLQLAAFLYGMNIVYQARPAYVVFVKDHFEVVAANEIHESNLAKVSRLEFKSMPWIGPRIVAAIPPKNADEADSVATAEQFGLGLQIFPQHYVPYADRAKEIIKRGKPLAILYKSDQNAKGIVERVLSRIGKRETDLRFLPLRSRTSNLVVLIDANSAAIIDVLPLKM